MVKKEKAVAQRHPAEQSPSDSDDNDHDHDDHDDQDDQDDHENSQDGSSSTVKRKRLTLACSNCRRKKIKCGKFLKSEWAAKKSKDRWTKTHSFH